MKWIFRLGTITMLLGALAFPFFIDNQNGEPMLSLPSADDLIPSQPTGSISPASTTTVYKWKGPDDVWHYTDQPPADTAKVETVEVDTRANVIQGFRPPKTTEALPETPTAQMTAPNENFLSVDRAMNVMKDAKLARQAMEQRNQQLQAIVGEQEN